MTPAAVNSVVGMILDKRLGLVRGTELRSGGAPVLVGTTTPATYNTTTGDGSVHRGVDANNQGYVEFDGLTPNAFYEITFTLTAGQAMVRIGGALGAIGATATTTGAYRYILPASVGGLLSITTNSINSSSASFTGVSLKSLPGNHATQATTASKPILRQSGALYYLEFDGVDDRLNTLQAVAQPFDRVSGLRQLNWTLGNILLGAAMGDYGTLYQSDTTPRLRLYSGAAGPRTAAATPAIGTDAVVTERFDGVNSRIAVGDAAYVVENAGSVAASALTIGSRGAGTLPVNFRFYGLTMIGRALTDAETANLRSYIATKSGAIL